MSPVRACPMMYLLSARNWLFLILISSTGPFCLTTTFPEREPWFGNWMEALPVRNAVQTFSRKALTWMAPSQCPGKRFSKIHCSPFKSMMWNPPSDHFSMISPVPLYLARRIDSSANADFMIPGRDGKGESISISPIM